MEQNVTKAAENNDVKEKESLTIDIESHADFNTIAGTTITTSDDLGKLINGIFGKVFKDYYGCKLDVTYVPAYCSYVVVPKLYFKVLPKDNYNGDNITAFIPMSEITADTVFARIQRVHKIAVTDGIKVEMTDDGKSVFKDYLLKNNASNVPIKIDDKFDWTQVYNVIPTGTETLIRVFKFDIHKLLRLIYGGVDENGSKLHYQVTPNGVFGSMNQYQKPANWNLIIMRLNDNNLKFAAKHFGVYMSNSAIDTINTDM